jgi:hypothetical protein
MFCVNILANGKHQKSCSVDHRGSDWLGSWDELVQIARFKTNFAGSSLYALFIRVSSDQVTAQKMLVKLTAGHIYDVKPDLPTKIPASSSRTRMITFK